MRGNEQRLNSDYNSLYSLLLFLVEKNNND